MTTALARLHGSALPRVLFASHAFGGGVARHMASLARAIEGDAEVLLLAPHLERFVSLRWLRAGEDLALWFATAEWDRMTALLEAIGVDRVHFHHVHGLPREALALPRRLGCPHDVTLHDYFPACPAYHMTGADGRYCGGDPSCARCLEAGPAQWPLSIGAWRAEFSRLLESARRVIAPSNDAAGRIRAFFPNASPVVWAHPEDEAPARGPILRVLVPGAISPAKGLDVLAACVRDAHERALPIHFRVLGYVSHPVGEWPALPVSVSGEYREGDLESLVALERGDAFFFPAQCPETWSYTLSTALASGLPIVATDLGALPERLAGRANARIVRWDAPAREMNDALLEFAPRSAGHDAAVARMSSSRYRALYLEGMARGAPAAATVPAADPAWQVEPQGSPALSSLAWLFEDAVRCGRGRSLEELRRRAGEADARIAEAEVERTALADARAALDRRQEQLREAAAAAAVSAREASALRGALDRIESSRSWRLTAPLRRLARSLRGGG